MSCRSEINETHPTQSQVSSYELNSWPFSARPAACSWHKSFITLIKRFYPHDVMIVTGKTSSGENLAHQSFLTFSARCICGETHNEVIFNLLSLIEISLREEGRGSGWEIRVRCGSHTEKNRRKGRWIERHFINFNETPWKEHGGRKIDDQEGHKSPKEETKDQVWSCLQWAILFLSVVLQTYNKKLIFYSNIDTPAILQRSVNTPGVLYL